MPMLKAIYGLGVTSAAHAITRLSKYKAIPSVSMVTAGNTSWPKDKVVVVAGLNVFARHSKKMRSDQIVIVSDIPSLLNSIDGLVPLDYSRKVSYLFNFKDPDFALVAKAAKKSSPAISVTYTHVDQLGYTINALKQSDSTINAFLGLISNIAFSGRSIINNAMSTFFGSDTPDVNALIASIKVAAKDVSIQDELNRFIAEFCDRASDYHMAYNSKLATSAAAKEYGVDEYALSYFKTKMNAQTAPKHRLSKLKHRQGLHDGKRASA